jgi:hypothetical protein
MKFLLASCFEIPLQEACSDFQIAACHLKIVPKAACDPKNCYESRRLHVHRRKSAIASSGKLEQKF